MTFNDLAIGDRFRIIKPDPNDPAMYRLACLSHGIRKKESDVPPHEIDVAIAHKELVKQDPVKYTTDWE